MTRSAANPAADAVGLPSGKRPNPFGGRVALCRPPTAHGDVPRDETAFEIALAASCKEIACQPRPGNLEFRCKTCDAVTLVPACTDPTRKTSWAAHHGQ